MNEATSSSATPRTKATAKTTAKAAATKTTRTAAKSTAKTTTKKPTTKRTSKPKTATKRTVGETPAPIINRTSPEQFGRVNVLGITPSAENGLYPARVELGEAFKVTAQVFIEGRTKAGATVSVRNTRGTEKARFPMTCTNPGLDRWEAMVKIGDHSDLKPWEDATPTSRSSSANGTSWSKAGKIRTLPGCTTRKSRSRSATMWRTRWNPARSCWNVGWRTRFQADRR